MMDVAQPLAAPEPKLKLEKFTDGPVTCLRLAGTIDEQFEGKKLGQTIKAETLILDLGGVRKISSFGIREWVDFVGTAGERVVDLYLVECSPKVVASPEKTKPRNGWRGRPLRTPHSWRLGVLAFVSLFAVEGAAAGKGAFEAAYEAGQDAFNLARYDEAWKQFQRARELAPEKPGPYRWLGRTARVREQWNNCLGFAMQALRLNPTGKQAPEVRKDVETCRSALGRPRYEGKLSAGQGALAVIANAEGAAVTVDGIAKGRTPLDPVPLVAGRHTLRVQAADTSTAGGPARPCRASPVAGAACGGAPLIELPVDILDGVVVDVEVSLPPRR